MKTLFIISPIGHKDSETRNHFDKVRRHIIDPVAKEKDYKTIRADEISRPGRITSQIIEHLKKDELVVADLSRKNPNVYYELAIRHAVQKPIILIGESELDIPFDLAAQRVIPYSIDPDDIIEAKSQLKTQIEAIESKNFIIDSPVTSEILLNLEKMPTSEESKTQRILAILEKQSISMDRLFERDLKSRVRESVPSYYEEITAKLMPSEAVNGDKVQIIGISYPNDEISIHIKEEDGSMGAPIATTRSNEKGLFAHDFVIDGYQKGEYEVVIFGDKTKIGRGLNLIIK